MKTIFIIIAIVLIGFIPSFAQKDNNLFMEVNLARYTRTLGILTPDFYFLNEISYLNGLNLGYHLSKRQKGYIGFRKVYKNFDSGFGYVVTKEIIRGIEFNIGWEFTPNIHKTFHLSYNVEFFKEFVKLKGDYHDDGNVRFEIHHIKTYTGIAPVIRFNYRITPKCTAIISSRWRIGYKKLDALGKLQPNNIELFPETNKWVSPWTKLFEPISSIGVRWEM